MTQDNDAKDYLSLSVRDFAAATAGKSPTPGGGSVAGAVGAMSAALGEMALNFTRGKKKFAEHEEYYARLHKRLARARGMFEDLVADDVSAYGLYQQATRMEPGPDKQEAVQLALAAAIDVPREAAKLALALLADLKEFGGRCNPYLISDLVAAAALAVATARLCDYNVRVNTPHLDDATAADEIKQASADDVAKADRLREEIEQEAGEHIG